MTGGYMATNVLISTVDFERSSTCLMPSIDGDPYIDYRMTATRCKEPCVDGVVRALRPYTVVRRDPSLVKPCIHTSNGDFISDFLPGVSYYRR